MAKAGATDKTLGLRCDYDVIFFLEETMEIDKIPKRDPKKSSRPLVSKNCYVWGWGGFECVGR